MKVLILGRGLAGSWMARDLLARNVDVHVYDPDTTGNASRVAAGLINPTTGSRPKSTWRSEVLLPFAVDAYQTLEQELGVALWTPCTIRRVFLTPKDSALWHNAVERGVGVDWSPLPSVSVDGIPLPHGGVEYAGATVDTNALIDAVGEHLAARSAILPAEPAHTEYDHVIWCQGWRASTHDLWKWLPFQPVKGEIIDAVIEGPPLTSIYIRGIWIVPGNGESGNGEWGMGNGELGNGEWGNGEWGMGNRDRGTVEPWNRGTVEPSNRGTVERWNRGNVEPSNRGTVEPSNRGTMEPWNRGTMEPWNHGTVEPSNRIRIGSTHDWDDMTDTPTDEARRMLVEKAEVILARAVTVIGQRAAVRPAARSKRPYIGVHPEHPQHAIVNGLGAKGSLWAPWAARQLADHLLDGKPLDEEVHIQRWWNP